MAAPGLPIQELWDEVIDSIHDSTVDLKSTSLVCRSFVARAQSHIFRQIALFATKAPRTTGDVAARLRNLMAFSPHLISHVQVLYLPTADEETLISVADIRWSHVHSVVLGFSRPTLLSPGIALEKVNVLVGLPTLRILSFQGGVWGGTHLQRIFAHCTARLQRLIFFHCIPVFPSHASPSQAAQSPRPKLSDLSVICSPDIAQILHDPVCALDFSALTKVYCVRSMSIDFEIFLLHYRATITNLHFAGTGMYAGSCEG
jgi:hypothetical protein